ncbi:hypothetical protein [Pseudomonas sp. DWP3-1-2]|uniref:hypothetical protein n=1 Tax=Pseudomonas sp. DWP3-1-2 TaxID=2804645 RepID=UPI003CF2BCD1
MSLEQSENITTDHSAGWTTLHEMQREDFLALATALRQFNACQSPVSMVIANAQYGGERHASLAIE